MVSFRILVVEDDRQAAESLATILRTWGYQVRTAYDAPSALADLDVFVPDALLSDLKMPGMSGCAVAERLGGEGILMIAMTAYGDVLTRAESKKAGFHHHLVKPLELERLRSIFEEYRQANSE